MNMSQIKQELDQLEIINVEAVGDLTQDLLVDAINAVKSLDIDINALAEEVDRCISAPSK